MVDRTPEYTDNFESERDYDAYRSALEDAFSKIPNTPYGATKTAELDVQFSNDPSFGLTKERYGWFSNGTLFDSTFFSDVGAKISIETGATTDDIARIRSAYAGQYLAHTISEPGLGMDIPSEHLEFADDGTVSLTHGEISAEVAQWDDTTDSALNAHGISFEEDGTYAQVRSSGSNVEFVRQENWNIDTLDGSGSLQNPSGKQLRPQDGYVYLFIYTWYGQGAYILAIEDPETSRVIPMHRFVPDENSPAVDGPNMPVQLTVENKNTADPLRVNLGGMQYTTHGKPRPGEATRSTEIVRHTSSSFVETNAVLNNGAVDPFAEPGVPLLATRRDQTDIDVEKGLKFELQSVTPRTTSDIYMFVWDEFDDTALTGGTFRFPNARVPPESKIEVNTEATAYAPSDDAVLRGVAFVPSAKNTPSDVIGDATSRIPLRATSVITAVLAPGSNSTDVQPAIARYLEGF